MLLTNTYWVLRHAESENNVLQVSNTHDYNAYRLTKNGVEQTKSAYEFLKDKNIEVIFVSPFLRTIETAYILSGLVGDGKVYVDERLAELKESHDDGAPLAGLPSRKDSVMTDAWWISRTGEETFRDLYARTRAFLLYAEKTYSGKTILIITHGSPENMLEALAHTESEEEARQFIYKRLSSDRPYRGLAEPIRF